MVERVGLHRGCTSAKVQSRPTYQRCPRKSSCGSVLIKNVWVEPTVHLQLAALLRQRVDHRRGRGPSDGGGCALAAGVRAGHGILVAAGDHKTKLFTHTSRPWRSSCGGDCAQRVYLRVPFQREG